MMKKIRSKSNHWEKVGTSLLWMKQCSSSSSIGDDGHVRVQLKCAGRQLQIYWPEQRLGGDCKRSTDLEDVDYTFCNISALPLPTATKQILCATINTRTMISHVTSCTLARMTVASPNVQANLGTSAALPKSEA
jgi:hypothetical protein